MSGMSAQELRVKFGQGLLAFPVTHFKETYELNENACREHVSWLLEYHPSALFSASATGEFFSLSLEEFSKVVTAAVTETAGKIPVLAGCGYGTSIARQFAKAAEDAGADGILLMPPYLVNPEAAGLVAHVQAVCSSTRLGVIFYNRDNAILDEVTLEQLCQRCTNLVGLKDGIGNLELMTRIISRLGERLVYICGLPTAESVALPCCEMGMTTYSSGIFNFLPDFAQRFYAAVMRRDRGFIASRLREFILPYIAIRNRRKGYAVSIVKAGMRATGRSAGPVRAPLTDLALNEQAELESLIAGLF